MTLRRAGLITLLFILLMTIAAASFAQTGGDRDGDNLPDTSDQCPDQAGPRENHGCPDRPADDRDGDGVADFVDQCPDQTGTGFTNGCPAGGGDTRPQPTDYVPIPPQWADPNKCMVGVPVNAPSNVNVRDSASMSATILGTVAPGTQWEPWLRDYDENNQIWFDGAPIQGGWVRGDQVILHGDCVYLPQVIHVDAPDNSGPIIVDFDPSLIPDFGSIFDTGIVVIDPGHIPTLDPTRAAATHLAQMQATQTAIALTAQAPHRPFRMMLGDSELNFTDRLIIAVLPDPNDPDPSGLPFESIVILPEFGNGQDQCAPELWQRGMQEFDLTDGGEVDPIALLLPAVQKVREAAARARGGVNVAVGDVTGDGGVMQDFHFFAMGDGSVRMGDGSVRFLIDGASAPGQADPPGESCQTWVFVPDHNTGGGTMLGFGLLLPAV